MPSHPPAPGNRADEAAQPSPSDRELVDRAGRGELAAFETLYHRHRDFVLRIARRYAASDAEAMDAAQEAFAYLLKKLPRLRLTGKLTTYLYPVAKSIALTVRRREGKRAGVEQRGAIAEVFAAEHGSGAQMSDPDAARRALRAGLAQLNEGQREVLLMRAVDGMSLEEVALALGVPEGTVKSRLHTALATLRANPALRDCFEQ